LPDNADGDVPFISASDREIISGDIRKGQVPKQRLHGIIIPELLKHLFGDICDGSMALGRPAERK
jgi:hypothetical protein